MQTKRLKFVQIATGNYTYDNKSSFVGEDDKSLSHAIYGLDDDGDVWKWIPAKGIWVQIEQTVPAQFKDKY